MSSSIQISGGTSVISEDGNIAIRGKVKSLKVNGEPVGEFKGKTSSLPFINGVFVGFLVGVFVAAAILL